MVFVSGQKKYFHALHLVYTISYNRHKNQLKTLGEKETAKKMLEIMTRMSSTDWN